MSNDKADVFGQGCTGRHLRLLLLVGGCALVLLYGAFLGRPGVLQQTEARYAEVAREMKASRDFLMPTLNGVPHVQKPPVTYWLTAGSMALFGENEIGARVPPLVAGLGTLALTAWIGMLWFNRRIGLLALIILAGFVEFYALSRSLCADMIMTFWSTAAIAAFACATRRVAQPPARHFAPFFVLMGIAFATKGPMGIVVPLCMAIAWQLNARRRGGRHHNIPWMAGMAITFAFASVWFLAVAWRHPDLWRYFLEYEFVDRFFSKVHGRSQPFWYFLPVLAGGLLPWSPLAIPLAFRNLRTGASGSSNQPIWALAGWIVVPLVLLSLSGSKLATYILPLLPGIAIWLAFHFEYLSPSRALTVAVLVQMAVLLIVGIAPMAGLLMEIAWPRGVVVDAWFPLLWLASIGMALCASWKLRQGITQLRATVLSLSIMLAIAVFSSQIDRLAPVMGTSVSLRPLAERIMREPDWKHAQIVVAGAQAHGMEFYLRRLVDCTRKEAEIVLPQTPELAARIHPTSRDIRFATDGTPIYVVTKERNLRRGEFPELEWDVVQRTGSFVLLLRQPPSPVRVAGMAGDHASTPQGL